MGNACEIEGCEKPRRKRGWCEMHYSRWKAHGTPDAPGRRSQVDACVTEGCSRPPLAKDLCRKHYYAQKRREARAARPPKPPKPRCLVTDCDRVAQVKGWCGAHYQRWRRHGDPEFVPPVHPRACMIEGCDEVSNARGLCGRHYYRWQTYGDPLKSKNAPRVSGSVRSFPPRACVTCGATFDPGTSSARKYCSRACHPFRASSGINNRRTVIRLGEERGWTCALCGLPVDSGYYWPAPKAGSVDHAVPVVEGGNDDWSNLQLTHLRCNLAKESARRAARQVDPDVTGNH